MTTEKSRKLLPQMNKEEEPVHPAQMNICQSNACSVQA